MARHGAGTPFLLRLSLLLLLCPGGEWGPSRPAAVCPAPPPCTQCPSQLAGAAACRGCCGQAGAPAARRALAGWGLACASRLAQHPALPLQRPGGPSKGRGARPSVLPGCRGAEMASSQPCPGCDMFFLPAGTLGCASVAVGSPVVPLGSAVTASCTIQSELCRGLEQGKVWITWMLDNEPVAGSQRRGPGGTEVSNLTLPQFNRTQAKLWCWVEWNGTKQRVGMAEIRAGCKSAAAMGHPHVHACTSQRRNLARERFSHLLPETPVCPRRSCWGASSSWGRWLMEAVSGLCPATSRRAGAQQAVGQGRFGERWRGSGALCRQARSGLRLLCSWDGRFAQALHRPVSPRPACEALQPQLHPEPQRLRADVPVGAGSRQPPPHQRRAEVCRVSLGG